ncbi:MAG: ATP-binding protein [Verrucomicrobiota bacterium]
MDYNPLSPAIRDILTAIRHRKSLEDVVGLILQRSCLLADAVSGSFVKVDHDRRELLITSVHGPGWTPEKQAVTLKIGQGVTGKVAETGIPHLCADTARDQDYYPIFDEIRCELAVPVMGEDRVWGIINLEGLEPHAFDANTLSTLRVFGELCAFAISLRLEMIEQERWQTRALKSEKLAALGEVIAGIAHEINNPLTSILGHANLLSLRHELVGDPSVEGIVTEAHRTASLVRSLLTFSRAEDTERRLLDVNELVDSVIGIKQYHLRVHHIRMEVERAAEPCPVRANPQQLQQVVLNLLNNAVQAIPEERDDGRIRLAVSRRGEQVVLTVEDNGVGICDEAQDQLFDPFFTTREVGQGRGLGLTVAHTILEQHGGGVTFHAVPGGGTQFVVHLPVAHPDPADTQTELVLAEAPGELAAVEEEEIVGEETAPDAPEAAARRVLVVDDEPLILDSLESFLSEAGLEPVLARDGEEALEALRRQPADVILSDIRMPKMDGLEFYTALGELDPGYQRRFLFMSGDLVRNDTRAFVANSGCPVLEKPFHMSRLLELLAEYGTEGEV